MQRTECIIKTTLTYVLIAFIIKNIKTCDSQWQNNCINSYYEKRKYKDELTCVFFMHISEPSQQQNGQKQQPSSEKASFHTRVYSGHANKNGSSDTLI